MLFSVIIGYIIGDLCMDAKSLAERLNSRLAVPLVLAGEALGLGRRRTKEAADAGKIPVTSAGTVPTSWLRQQLRLADQDEHP
jgi:hypothetical protein